MAVDRAKAWEFIERFVELAAGAGLIGVLAVADRSGLLRALGEDRWVTAEEVARAGFAPRYVEEILAALAAGGVVRYRPEDQRFSLPAEHAACLVDPESPYLMAGWLDLLPAVMNNLDAVAAATVHGGGVPLQTYDERVVAGIDRANSPSMRILLTRRWLPAVNGLVEKLAAGARVADIGCGSGTAALVVAQAFPASTVVGYDLDPRAVGRARRRAAELGVNNVSYEQRSATEIPAGFDLVTAFDVVHDLSDPLAVLRRVREALTPGGVLVMMEPNAGPELADNLNPYGSLLYSTSVLFCLPQSLVGDGAGLGTAWGPRRAEELCRQAGFSVFRRLPIENPFSAFYEVRP